MLIRNLQQIWDQLRVKHNQFPQFLESVTIKNLRGIKDLTVRFGYPVTVLAGPNASGKSTVLFSCACAYKVPNVGSKNFVPSTLFPNLKISGDPSLSDLVSPTVFEFFYIEKGKTVGMRWTRGKTWNRSYMGQSGGTQPTRQLYVRTLANLTSPNEVRSFLQIGQSQFEKEHLTSDLISFAARILPIKYKNLFSLKKGFKNLLFAHREDEDDSKYSEFHMSSGERALLHISRDISKLRNALILIDEIEAGLHPYTQQQVMLELQRLALRNDLQIIVTSHSPVVLESVPVEGRIFLERNDSNVAVKPPYKDVIQKAFYGQSLEKLFILCEDGSAESFLHGCFDILNPKLGLVHDDISIGRDTSKNEFSNHISAIGKFQQLDSFLFVLDGDAKKLEPSLKVKAQQFGANIQPLFLPGDVPEKWAWQVLKTKPAAYDALLGLSLDDLKNILDQNDRVFDNAADKPTEIAKNKFFSFCDQISRTVHDVIRIIARKECENPESETKIFLDELENQVRTWQIRR